MRIVVTIMGFCLTAGFMPSMANAVDAQIIEAKILLKEIASIKSEVVDLRTKFIGSGGIIPVLENYMAVSKYCGSSGKLHKGGTPASPICTQGNGIVKDAEMKGSRAYYPFSCSPGFVQKSYGVLDRGKKFFGGGSDYRFCVKL